MNEGHSTSLDKFADVVGCLARSEAHTIKSLVQLTGYGVETIKRYLKALRDEGLVEMRMERIVDGLRYHNQVWRWIGPKSGAQPKGEGA